MRLNDQERKQEGGNTCMDPEKMNVFSISTIRNKGVDAIAAWFDLHIQRFYVLGWSYVRNQQQMEELFYRSIIKVYKDLPRYKNDTSFETWVTSIFLHNCRELSDNRSWQASEKNETRQDVFNALGQLKEYEKEAMVLTYVKGISKRETSHLIQVSVEKLNELLFSGIQSLRKEMGNGSDCNGCKQYHKDYLDYLEGNLERSKKIDLEVHVYHCQNCQEDLGSFQEVMLTMLNLSEKIEEFHVPPGFMENVRERLAEKERHRQLKNKKRIRMGLVFASVFSVLMSIGFFTGAFTNLYYTWTEEDQELRAFLQQDLGERLNLEAESAGVKIRIRSVIADDLQTLVFYEIEDLEEDNQYMMINYDGVIVENEQEIMVPSGYSRYYPPVLEKNVNSEKKNVFQGKISLLPLKNDTGTIKLNITKLQKLIHDSSQPKDFFAYGSMGHEGEWSFEIPVTKQPSVEYELAEETEVEGIPVRFEKLIIAPTATILQYDINNEQPGKRIDVVNFSNLEVNNKKVKADRYGSSFWGLEYDISWTTAQTVFDPLFGEKPKEVNVQFASVYITYEDQKIIELDASKVYPQTFEYAGSTISIDKVEIGQPSTVVLSNHETKNRAYHSMQFHIVAEGEDESSSIEMNTEGVIVDKNGTEYDMNKNPVSYEEIEQPKYFTTVENVILHGNQVVPKSIVILGYNKTTYFDDVVRISLE
jgi:DNA-directed RNA polymerase specialized sigma24 family protein